MKPFRLFCIASILALWCLPVLAGEHPALEIPGRPTDEVLLGWMQRPALETLSNVDYVRLNDGNFEQVTLGGDNPVIVLFISDKPARTYRNSSRGMAALATALKTIYPEVTLGVYKVNDNGFVTTKEFDHLKELYEIRNVPQMLFYNAIGEGGTKERNLNTLDTGITWDGDLLFRVDEYAREFVPEYMLKAW